MTKIKFRAPSYYPFYLKVLTFIHWHLERYCSKFSRKFHFEKNKITKSFKMISKMEFWLRNFIKPLTAQAKTNFNSKF